MRGAWSFPSLLSLASVEVGKPLDVARDQVHLEVHLRPGLHAAKRGDIECMRNQIDVEARARHTPLTVRLTPWTAIEPLTAMKRASAGGASISSR